MGVGRWKISQTRHFPDYRIKYRAAQRRGELSWVHPAVWTLGGQGVMAVLLPAVDWNSAQHS